MSDLSEPEYGNEDFGGAEEVRLERGEEFVVENERREGEGVGAENEFHKGRESYSVENDGETMPWSSWNNKRIKEISIDRLSALPDALLIHILSFLNFDVKAAAVTSVLSKRWQYLWSELPRLNFWSRSWEIERARDFVSWVHRTLLFRTGTYLEQFGVDFLYDECYASDVNAWVRFAVKSKVKQLSLELHSSRHFYTLPQVLYSNSALKSLYVQRCIVAPQRTIEWQSLTQLNVDDVELDEHVIQKILSGCPVLCALMFKSCWGFKRLDVNSETLHELTVLDYDDRSSVDLMDVSTPYLRSLHISFCPVGKKLHLPNVSSLVSANIYFSVLDKSMVVMNTTMELLEKIRHAKELILGGAFVEVVSELVVRGWRLPQSSRRDCLVIETWRDEDSIPGILALLESSPNLETLLIECCDPYEKSVRTWGPAARNDLDCDLSDLKIIRLFDYADPYLGGEPMLTIARILLKRATALEKMVIDAHESLTKFSSDFTKMSQTVLSYPRSSKKAVVVLRQ